MGLFSELFASSKDVDKRKPEHTNLVLVDIRDSIREDLSSGELVSYNRDKPIALQLDFDDKLSKELTSPVYDTLIDYHDIRMLLRIENGDDCINVSYPDDGMCIYVEADNVGVVACPVRDGVEAEETIILLSGLMRRSAPMSLRMAELGISGVVLDEMNTELADKYPSELDFGSWSICRDLFGQLHKSTSTGVRLYRGCNLPKKYDAGATIPLSGFTDWSFSISRAIGSGTSVFAIYPDEQFEGAFVTDRTSGCHEVLLNVGYRLRVKRAILLKVYSQMPGSYIEGTVYECVLEKDPDSAPRAVSAFESSEDSDVSKLGFALSQLPLNNSAIGKAFYVDSIEAGSIDFCKAVETSSGAFDAINVSVHSKADSVVLSYVTLGAKRSQKHYKTIPVSAFSETLGVVETELSNMATKLLPDDYQHDVGLEVLFRVAKKFQHEGYLLSKQTYDFDKAIGRLLLDGVVNVNIAECEDGVIDLRCISGSVRLHTHCEGTAIEVANKVYSQVVNRFALNQYNRVQEVLNLVAKYKQVGIDTRSGTNSYFILGNMEIAVIYGDASVTFSDNVGNEVLVPSNVSMTEMGEAVLSLWG